MTVALYMDQHVPRAITAELRSRGIDVITAYEDGTEDLLAEATRRQRVGIAFGGVVYAHQLRVPIGTCIRELEIIAKAGTPDDLRDGVVFLPL